MADERGGVKNVNKTNKTNYIVKHEKAGAALSAEGKKSLAVTVVVVAVIVTHASSLHCRQIAQKSQHKKMSQTVELHNRVEDPVSPVRQSSSGGDMSKPPG